jgi:hypothetical protein
MSKSRGTPTNHLSTHNVVSTQRSRTLPNNSSNPGIVGSNSNNNRSNISIDQSSTRPTPSTTTASNPQRPASRGTPSRASNNSRGARASDE